MTRLLSSTRRFNWISTFNEFTRPSTELTYQSVRDFSETRVFPQKKNRRVGTPNPLRETGPGVPVGAVASVRGSATGDGGEGAGG